MRCHCTATVTTSRVKLLYVDSGLVVYEMSLHRYVDSGLGNNVTTRVKLLYVDSGLVVYEMSLHRYGNNVTCKAPICGFWSRSL